ncbi:MAG TPA: hypothetical protein VEQ41_03155 [Solirubrobacterales bacterium]|nr:hypothetical protein [Solirubrobacterales bacterium]
MASPKAARLDTEIVEMTPRAAREILDRNARNRSLRSDYVRKLGAAMERGEWTVNGEPIQIAEDGTLLNGQHRLSAVVESGVSVPMLVVRGLPPAAQRTMDTGTRRNLSDVLALHGQIDTANLGAMLGLLHRYRIGERLDNTGRTAPTPKEALALLEREPKLTGYIPLGRKTRAVGMRVSVAAVLAYLFDEADPGEGTRFFEALCNFRAEPQDSPIRALKKTLERVRNERAYRISTYVLCGMTIKAFNSWRAGRPITVLFFRAGAGESFPKILKREEIEAGAVEEAEAALEQGQVEEDN